MFFWFCVDNFEKLFIDCVFGMLDFNVYFVYEMNVDDVWIFFMNMDIGF